MYDLDLDRIDRRILAHLQADGRATNLELAQAVGLSPAQTAELVATLAGAGIVMDSIPSAEFDESCDKAKALMRALERAGWNGVVVHFRGCSGEPNRLPRAFNRVP